MSLTFNVTFSTKNTFLPSALNGFMLFVFAFFHRFSVSLSLGCRATNDRSHQPPPHTKEKNMVSRNLFDGFVYMEKCLTVAWGNSRDGNRA